MAHSFLSPRVGDHNCIREDRLKHNASPVTHSMSCDTCMSNDRDRLHRTHSMTACRLYDRWATACRRRAAPKRSHVQKKNTQPMPMSKTCSVQPTSHVQGVQHSDKSNLVVDVQRPNDQPIALRRSNARSSRPPHLSRLTSQAPLAPHVLPVQ